MTANGMWMWRFPVEKRDVRRGLALRTGAATSTPRAGLPAHRLSVRYPTGEVRGARECALRHV
jgi:hypothetical protein